MRIVIGCPVRNRAWVLPSWLRAIRQQKTPVKIVCLVSDSDDGTEEILRDEGLIKIIKDTYPGRTTTEIDNHHWGRIEDYAYMAEIRNTLLEVVIEEKADYFFSLDSDIILPDGALEHLLQRFPKEGGIMAPAVNMGQVSAIWNVMNWEDRRQPGKAVRSYTPSSSGFVDVIMAAMLMDKHGMQVRWQAHHQGEDVGFCLDATNKAIPRYWDPSLRCDHLMRRFEISS